ncbi:kelch repeat [Chrysochromulina tobinii]|uniref:Kelch repeat n=1 Tax=Chrysochromulina tobinii TaxID=1460289 RepID=A0A0M0JUV0_9EUKA|nr:kelch repeat [Chrysochromulina tobinii]|eukprot:KOO29923.1 kelch repeat [Chrysochromulina sp. CCMP291]
MASVSSLWQGAGELVSRVVTREESQSIGAASSAEAAKAVRKVPATGVLPSPRESHSLTSMGARLYVFGGFDGARVLNDLYAFDTQSGIWSQLVHTGLSPPARAGHSATALGVPAHLLVFGGANSSRRFNDVQLFDTADNHWNKPTVRGRAPSPRYYHCACLARGSLLVLGGNDGITSLEDLHALNTESWTWSQPLANGTPPSARCGASGTLVNKLFFVVGGVGDVPLNDPTAAAAELNDVHVLDTESWTWWRPEVSPPLPPIAYHAACLTADKIFFFGGSTRDALYNDVLVMDTASCTWRVALHGDSAKLPRKRRLAAARGAGTRLLLFGGWEGTHTSSELLEIDTSEWLRLEGAGGAHDVKAKRLPGGTLNAVPASAGGAGGGALATFEGGAGVPLLRAHGHGFGSDAGGHGAHEARLEEMMERLEARHEEELQRMRGEVARLRMSNELMGRELGKLKTLVGASLPGEHGGLDVEALATKAQLDVLKAEVAKLRRLGAQEREADKGAMHAEIDSLRRAVHALAEHIDTLHAPPPE